MYSMVNWDKGGNCMKIFISWSGELSKAIAKELSEWLPSIIQSIDVFYSPEDIKKGENWDNKLTTELENCDFGIVCLTSENVLAPWIHFEAGALSKKLDSRVSALMVNVVPSDIQGPLSRFQATKLEKDDFYKLVKDINDVSSTPISEKVLQNSFEAIWGKMYDNISRIIEESGIIKDNSKVDEPDEKNVDKILEEILQLMRKQDMLIGNPERLLPPEYMKYIINGMLPLEIQMNPRKVMEFEHLCHSLSILMENKFCSNAEIRSFCLNLLHYARNNGVPEKKINQWKDYFFRMLINKDIEIMDNVEKDESYILKNSHFIDE